MKKAAAILILLFLAVVIPVLYYWGHHYFVMGLNPYAGTILFIIFIVIAIPLIILFTRWLAKLGGGPGFYSPALLFAIAALSFFLLGIIEQIYIGYSTLDIHLHDTYYVLKGFSYTIIPALFALFAIVYFSIEKFTGKHLNRILSYTHFVLTFIIGHLIFISQQFRLGAVMPRRYWNYENFQSFAQFKSYENLTNTWIIILIIAQLLFLFNLIITLTKKRQLSI